MTIQFQNFFCILRREPTEFTIYRDTSDVRKLIVEHSGGTKSQGTDTLTDVMQLNFSDGSIYKVDDFPNYESTVMRTVNLDETVTGSFEYRPAAYKEDVEYFYFDVAPNSPFYIDLASNN